MCEEEQSVGMSEGEAERVQGMNGVKRKKIKKKKKKKMMMMSVLKSGKRVCVLWIRRLIVRPCLSVCVDE